MTLDVIFMQRRVVLVVAERAVTWQASENCFKQKKRTILCQTVVKRVWESKNLRIAINNGCTTTQCINCDSVKCLLKSSKKQVSLGTDFIFLQQNRA